MPSFKKASVMTVNLGVFLKRYEATLLNKSGRNIDHLLYNSHTSAPKDQLLRLFATKRISNDRITKLLIIKNEQSTQNLSKCLSPPEIRSQKQRDGTAVHC
jgi:hypothetical protein